MVPYQLLLYCKIGHPNPPAPITKIFFEFALPQITILVPSFVGCSAENPE
jgi:hypothetical protein